MGMFAIVILSKWSWKVPLRLKFSVFPNPSTGIVGIKFDNKCTDILKSRFLIRRGRWQWSKDILVDRFSYLQLAVTGFRGVLA